MYVGYILDKEVSMYPGPLRRSSINLSTQNFVSPSQYSEYAGYHVPNMEHHPQSSVSWTSPYGPPREDWSSYGPGPSNTVPVQISNSSPGQVSYSSPDYNAMNPSTAGILPPLDTISVGQTSPNSQRRNPYEWMKKTTQVSAAGKTRTKDKYRVVYTDHQRLELEKEFHYNRYITIKRKAELATILGLSERQVKIWFQNRRAKERKMTKKQLAQSDGCLTHHGPGPGSPVEMAGQMLLGGHISGGPSVGNMAQVTVTL
ncbi:homeobox protein CDX-4 [Mobula hypostoma]|uniref:homeobox protein CDX-4 n=1 Tax=Mobula hypostoma TaxID=723540 RepID=UPI002FC37AE3